MDLVMKKCPTEMCHASTLLKLNKQQILIAWFGGSVEGNNDVGIWLSIKNNDGFAEPRLISKTNEAHWNPVLFRINNEKIILFYKIGNDISKWRTMYCISEDNGKTFSDSKELVTGDKGGRGPVRNKPIYLKTNRILAPGSTENGIWKSFVDISDDLCNSWKKSSEVEICNLDYKIGERVVEEKDTNIPVSEQSFYGKGVIQPTIWEGIEDGQVHMLLRSTEEKIFKSDSTDYGETWTDAYPIKLENNNSGIDVTKTKNGVLYLVYNPVGKNWGPRSPISLAKSEDNGNSWDKIKDLSKGDGEFSYPAIISDEEYLYITYTFKRVNIAFWKIKY